MRVRWREERRRAGKQGKPYLLHCRGHDTHMCVHLCMHAHTHRATGWCWLCRITKLIIIFARRAQASQAPNPLGLLGMSTASLWRFHPELWCIPGTAACLPSHLVAQPCKEQKNPLPFSLFSPKAELTNNHVMQCNHPKWNAQARLYWAKFI